MTALLADLLDEADQQQLDNLLERAATLRDDFSDLACTVGGDAQTKNN
jgi:hypothetical protein